MSARIVKVGDRQVEVQAFSGYKFLEATDLLAQALEVVPELDEYLGSWGERYAEQHNIKLDRATAEFRFGKDDPRLEGISAEAWASSGNTLQLDAEPGVGLVAVHLLPRLYRHARPQLERLVALILTPNSELEADDEAGRDPYTAPEGSVAKQLRIVRHRSRMAEWAKALTVTLEVLQEELQEADLSGLAGKAANLLAGLREQPQTEQATEAKPKAKRKRATPAEPASSPT